MQDPTIGPKRTRRSPITGRDEPTAKQQNSRVEPGRGPLLYADDAAEGRLRRPVDGLLVLTAAFLFVSASVIARVSETSERHILVAADTLLGWFGPGWQVLFTAMLGYGCLVLLVALLSHRWRLTRDMLVAVAAVVVVGVPIARLVRSSWPTLVEGPWTATNQYPGLRVAAVVAVLIVAGPELTRTARLVALWFVLLGSAAAVVLGIAYTSSVVGGITLGVAVAGAVRLAFGSAAGFPSSGRVLAGLGELGLSVASVVVAPRQRAGVATYTGMDADGRHLVVVVLGRDAQETQRLATAWRNLAYREGGPDLATGRLHQVEHESLITLLAERAGVLVPRVRVAGVVGSGDAILVTEQPDAPEAEQAGDRVSDEFLASLWGSAATLRTARLAHGGLNLSNVLVTDSGPVIVRFNRGQLAAHGSALDTDLAELLVASSIATSPERALAAAMRSVGTEALAAALPFLQRAALTPHLRDLAHSHEVNLKELRVQAATATRVALPEIVPMRRLRARDALLTLLVAVAGYLIITQLSQIGFHTIVTELSEADWRWAVAALVVAQLTFLTAAVSLRGAVLTPLPLQPCVALQAALKFISLTVPSSAGTIAVNIRFLQKLGVPTGEAVASGAVDGVSDTIIQIVLVLLILPFVNLNADLPPIHFGETGGLLLVLLAVALAVFAVVLAHPKWRAKVVPTVRDALRSLLAVAGTRSKRVQLFGGNVATQVLFALTLGAACHAYGASLPLAELLLVNMGASVFASVVPVPGGVGVAEAGITAGLVAVGLDQPTAFAVALTHRMCTNYLPPLWGFLALRWLSRKAYL
jgi:uncharacterized membrane protein YbhN (UPF0104 family)